MLQLPYVLGITDTTNLDGSTSREAIERTGYAYNSPCLWRPTTKSSGLQLPGLLQRADAQREQPAPDRSYRSERFETNWSQRLFPKSQAVEHAQELHYSFERLHAMGFGSRKSGCYRQKMFCKAGVKNLLEVFSLHLVVDSPGADLCCPSCRTGEHTPVLMLDGTTATIVVGVGATPGSLPWCQERLQQQTERPSRVYLLEEINYTQCHF